MKSITVAIPLFLDERPKWMPKGGKRRKERGEYRIGLACRAFTGGSRLGEGGFPPCHNGKVARQNEKRRAGGPGARSPALFDPLD